MGFQPGIEVIEHDAGLDHHGARLGIEFHYLIEPAGGVDHQRFADGLAALAGARAAGQNRHLGITGNIQGNFQIFLVARENHA